MKFELVSTRYERLVNVPRRQGMYPVHGVVESTVAYQRNAQR